MVEALGSSLTFPNGGGVSALAKGDFNGDGKLDLAVTQSTNVAGVGGRDFISVMLGRGDGTFMSAKDIAILSGQGILAQDVNADGKLDLLLVSPKPSAVLVFIGRGDGTFADAMTTDLSQPIRGDLQAADLNGDSRMDLAVLNSNNSVSTLIGNGDGSFNAAVEHSVGDGPQDLAIADVNGDGRPDLVVASYASASIETLLNSGQGEFLPAMTSHTRADTTGLFVGNFDRDDKPDIVFSANAGPQFFSMAFMKGNGDGTFQTPAAADYLPIQYGPNRGRAENRATDLDGDGHSDVVWVGQDNLVTVGLGDGAGRFSTSFWVASPGPGTDSTQLDGNPGRAVVVGDFNGDGRRDLAIGSAQSNPRPGGVSVLLGNAGGTFQAARSYPSQRRWSGIDRTTTLADFNGDGMPDLATITDPLDLIPGNADGTFGRSFAAIGHVAGPGEFYNTLKTADFDRDGKPDLAWLATGGVQGGPGPRHFVAWGAGKGTFAGPLALPPRVGDWGGRNIALGDFNKDGYPDLAIWTAELYGHTAEIGIYQYDPARPRTFSSRPVLVIGPTTGTTGKGPGIVAADFDGDGNLDLVAHSGVTNSPFEPRKERLLLFRGHGDGTFDAAKVVGSGLPEIVEFAAADLNGDGKADLVGVGGYAYVLLGNGDGTFASQIAYPASNGPVALKLIDMNGDGLTDIVAGAYSGTVSVLRGRGDGTFAAGQSFAIGAIGALTVDAGDLNGDGLPDLVVGHSGTNKIHFTVLLQIPAAASGR